MQIAAPFITVDLAKTQTGEWIVIEVNYAQESGHVGVIPYTIWNNLVSGL